MKNILSYKYILPKIRFRKIYENKNILIICLILVMSSCKSPQSLSYFPTLKDSTFNLVKKNYEPVIQKADILYIGVSSLDPISSSLFNSANAIIAQSATNSFPISTTPGIIVDDSGNIQLPKIGIIKALGKTKGQLTHEVQTALTNYLKDPIVTIRFMNFRVTVLGEVAHPSVVSSPNEKLSILEAIGMSGDLTVYGNRENILLVRDNNGKQETHRINLKNNNLFNSPYYYLQSGDLIYVEPNNARVFTSTKTQLLLPSILAGLSLLVVLINTFK